MRHLDTTPAAQIAFYETKIERLEEEIERLRELSASAQKCAEEKTAMIAELHKQRDENEHLRELEEENQQLREIASAAKNLVENSYVPSCDGDRQRWLMLKAAINAAREADNGNA